MMISILQQLRRLVRRNRGPGLDPEVRSSPLAAPGGEKMVLIVDLDGRTGSPLGQSLARSGFGPHVVRRGGAALGMLGRAAPAAVIVAGPADPDLYRALRRATRVPLLALDPQADDAQVLAAFAAGVDQFQAGPISPDEVVARVQALLRRFPAR